MIQYLEDRSQPISMTLTEAIDLQEKLAKAIAFMYRNVKKFPCTQIIEMPMLLDNHTKIQQASSLRFVIQGE